MQLGIISLEEEEPDLHRITELLEIINDQTIRVAKLVDNIRKISNIEDEDQSLTKLDLCKYLKKAIRSIRDSNKSRELEIQIHSNIKKAYINANSFIEDLFENILINAIKYNDSSIIKIDISIQNFMQDHKNYIRLEFEDNGIGIENSRKARIFEPLNSQNKSSNGLGVGLSLVKKILENYNGKIWVENKVQNDYSKGSKFIMMIPKAK
ncbi:MAG: GHKL domain-containing protein [Candidatus Lokiarchaeota archaeon]|nr:GHKL domain-containing protein [Candidatus Lokiarchaeota archaeon]